MFKKKKKKFEHCNLALMFSNISSISFVGCASKWLVNEKDKRGVTFSSIRARVEPVLQTKPFVHSTTATAHCKYGFG